MGTHGPSDRSELDQLLEVLESGEYDQVSVPVSVEDLSDQALFDQLIDEEARETSSHRQAQEQKTQAQVLSRQGRRMRRTRSLKVRQKFAQKQVDQKQKLTAVRQLIKLTEPVDDTRCIKEGV
jgi:hypothetical protein